MKKLRIFLCLMLALVVGAVSAACGSNPVTPNIPPDPGTTPGNNKPAYSYTSAISVYMPDGAPALGFAKLMNDDNTLGKANLTYTVVTASAIGDYVRDKSATVAVMPVNAASLLCGKGDAYKMAAVLTHGNLFVIGKGEAAKLEDLKGSVVEVVNINNVPGLTFMSLLKGANIDYVVGDKEDAPDPGKVTLAGNNGGTEIAVAIKAGHYVVAPEPAVSNVTKKTGAKINMNLQTLWNDEDGKSGYPQAVLMVKNDLLRDEAFMTALYSALEESAEWVKTNGAAAATAVGNHFIEGGQTSLNGAALTEAAVTGCNIRVQKSADAKSQVNDYIAKIRTIRENAASVVSDAFFA